MKRFTTPTFQKLWKYSFKFDDKGERKTVKKN